MDNVVEFPKPEPDKPDAQFTCVVVRDGKPEKWFKFCCQFTGPDGLPYGFHIWARDYSHADDVLAALRVSAEVQGQLFAEVQA